MNAQHGKLSDPWSYYNYENCVIKVDLMVLQNEKTEDFTVLHLRVDEIFQDRSMDRP